MKAVGDKVIFEKLEEPLQTPGGLFVPESSNRNTGRGKVISVHRTHVNNGVEVPSLFMVGDIIVYMAKSVLKLDNGYYCVQMENVIYVE